MNRGSVEASPLVDLFLICFFFFLCQVYFECDAQDVLQGKAPLLALHICEEVCALWKSLISLETLILQWFAWKHFHSSLSRQLEDKDFCCTSAVSLSAFILH